MNFYIWSGVISLAANVTVGIFVLSRNPSDKRNRLFCLFSFLVSGWSVGSSLANMLSDQALALWILRLNYLCGMWVPSVYVHLAHSLNQDTPSKSLKRKIFYAASIIFSVLVLTPYLIAGLVPIRTTTFLITKPGPAYHFFFAFFTICTGEVIFQILMGLRGKVGLEKKQFKYLAVANLLAIFAGFEYFLRTNYVFPDKCYQTALPLLQN